MFLYRFISLKLSKKKTQTGKSYSELNSFNLRSLRAFPVEIFVVNQFSNKKLSF